jgi:thiol-disulfide isomerase/thioredoxin
VLSVSQGDLHGIMKLVEGKRGKVVVLDAWSTWCEPCVKEFPNLVQIHREHGADKVACISVSCNYDGLDPVESHHETVLAFLRDQGAAFDNVLATEEADAIFKKLEVPSIPAVLVFGKDGALVQRFGADGSFTYEDVRPVVEGLLKAE